MTGLTPYLHFAGTAREALTFYSNVFGGTVQLHTFEEMQNTDGPGDSVGHGYLVGSPVALFAADVSGDQQAFRTEGLLFSLLGTAPAPTLRQWFSALADGGRVIDDLQRRPWGAIDGQVVDRFGLHWLIGFEGDSEGDGTGA
jgi:PhnB protein